MPDTLPPIFDAEFTAQIAECNAARIVAEHERARTKARTPAQRKADYIEYRVECALEEADEGPTSYPDTYMEPGGYTAYGERVAEDAAVDAEREWNEAVALWNATPGTEDGDEKFCAVEARFPDWDIADVLMTMEEECGEVK